MPKKCIKCGIEKPKTVEFFYYRNKSRGWFSSWCKECKIAHRKENMDRELELQRLRRGSTSCKICGTYNKQPHYTYCVDCKKESDREKKRIDKCIYKKRLKVATPKWADKKEIKRIYSERPEGCHVDHIIPLKGELVSGLHIPTNLQYLPAIENIKKSNHYSLAYKGRQ